MSEMCADLPDNSRRFCTARCFFDFHCPSTMFCGYVLGGLSACVSKTDSASSPKYTWDAGTDAGADAGADASADAGLLSGGGGGGGGKSGCALAEEASPSIGLFLVVLASVICGARRSRKRCREL